MKWLVNKKVVKGLIFCISLLTAFIGEGQKLPKVLIITGNGNVPNYQEEYPPWIHEFQNEKVVDILKGTAIVDVTTDLNVLHTDRLRQYDIVISNSIFLTPNKEQLEALHEFVANGKSYFTIHCGILSLLNWDKYEDFIGGIFIGGPSSVPAEFKVVTSNVEFWGYQYSFRKHVEHPISIAADDFVTKDELYHFQPSVRDFHVIARAENLPVMWWHPVGRGKVMSLTLGHDEAAKNNPGYQSLLKYGIQWLAGMPLIHGKEPKVVSLRHLEYNNFMTLYATVGMDKNPSVRFNLTNISAPDLFTINVSPEGRVKLTFKGKSGQGTFTVSATGANGFTATKTYDVRIVEDGVGNIAAYHGNTATSSSSENDSGVFDAVTVLDNDPSTRWSSAPEETAWVKIDLQKSYNVKKIELHWEASYASQYNIEGSVDGKLWKQLVSVSDGNGDIDSHSLNNVQIRYIRVNGTKRANEKWGYSLYEVKVYR